MTQTLPKGNKNPIVYICIPIVIPLTLILYMNSYRDTTHLDFIYEFLSWYHLPWFYICIPIVIPLTLILYMHSYRDTTYLDFIYASPSWYHLPWFYICRIWVFHIAWNVFGVQWRYIWHIDKYCSKRTHLNQITQQNYNPTSILVCDLAKYSKNQAS